jgi:hypothetical protein
VSSGPTRLLGRATVLLTALLALLAAPGAAQAVEYDSPPEDYASYQPQTKCRTAARPGTRALADWVNAEHSGGAAKASVRPCGSGGASEHKDGRAIDWSMDASRKKHRREVGRFLEKLFAEDADGHRHALARRMGIMYVIWNDRIYASYDEFARRDYKSSSCPRVKSCSATLRHRDHVHISLSRRGGRGATSWYAAHG